MPAFVVTLIEKVKAAKVVLVVFLKGLRAPLAGAAALLEKAIVALES